MMALKFFFLALLVTYSAQGIDAKSTTFAEESGLIEAIRKLVKEAIELVHQTLDLIKGIAKDLYDSLQEQAKEEVKKALEKVQKIREEVLEALKKLAEEAEGLGEEALTCVEDKRGDILKMVGQAQENTLTCVISLEREVKGTVINVKNVVSQSLKRISDLLAKFNACEKILCQVGVVTEAIGAVQNIKDNVLAAIENARETVKVEIPKFVKCTTNVAEDFKNQSRVITEEIVACLNKIE